jgi:drug/metabolite transporter (DMT)-like permease
MEFLSGASGRRRGILWMLLSCLLFAHVNAIAKHLSMDYPTLQVLWVRFAFQALMSAPLLGRGLFHFMRTRVLGLQLLRSFYLAVCTVLFFVGLQLVSFVEITAVLFLAPILVTALSAPMLGETVGKRRWAGVIVGFAGALIIVRPGIDILQLSAIVPLGAAAFLALYQISSRVVSRSDHAMTTLAYTPLVGLVITSVLVPFVWQVPNAEGWFFMVLLGIFGSGGQYALIKAFEAAEASAVVPFFYSLLIWATILGFIVWDELPDAWTVLGAAVMIASGLYILHREQVHRGERSPL